MADWYYSRGGQQQGPVPEATFIQWVQAGNVGPSDLVWRDGMASWIPLSTVTELAGYMPAGAGGQPAAGGYGQQPAAYGQSDPYAQPAAYGGQPGVYGQQGGYGQPGQQLQYGMAQSHYAQANTGRPYANFGWRLLAYIIDYVLLQVVATLINLAFGVGMQFGPGFGRSQQNVEMGAVFAAAGLNLAINWLYYAIMESSVHQGTLGKIACGIVVTDMTGQRIGFGRATGRYFGKILSGLICLIGYIMQAFTDKKQALHDMMAGTLVFKK